MPPPQRRAGAQRSVDQLVSAAVVALDRDGAGASLDDIARAAGVGNATLYRHFPRRVDLLLAVYHERMAALLDRAVTLRSTKPAGQALFAWIDALVLHAGSSRGLRDAMSVIGADDATEAVRLWHERLRAAAEPLVTDARRAGAVRAGIGYDDLVTVVMALVGAAGGDGARGRRLVRLALDGVRRER